MDIVYKPLSEIRPYFRNPRRNDKTIELLVKLIKKVGFNVPIVIDKDGVIVKGHARFVAAIRLGMNEVPCIISTATDDDNKLDRLADNLVSEFSEWVTEDLFAELKDLNVGFDMRELNLPNFFIDDVNEVIIDGNNENHNAYKTNENTEDEHSIEEQPVDNVPEKHSKGHFIVGYKVVCPYCGKTTIKPV